MTRAFLVIGLMAGTASAQDALSRVYQGQVYGNPTGSYYQGPYGGYYPSYGSSRMGGTYQGLPGGYRTYNAPVHPRYQGYQGMYSPTPQRINLPSGLGTTRR